MRPILVLTAALCSLVSTAHAVKFNPEAMQTMRSAGEKIAREAMQPRNFRVAGGLCLHRQGQNVITIPCRPKDPAQIWRLDEKGAVLHQSGGCLTTAGNPAQAGTNVVVQPCGNAPRFRWTLRADEHLASVGNTCVHALGDLKTPGANVIVDACRNIPNQRWK